MANFGAGLANLQKIWSTGGASLIDGVDQGLNDLGRSFDQQFLGGAEKDAAEKESNAAKLAEQGIADRFRETSETLDPFITGGLSSFDLQQAQSGALGPEAQAEAFANFNESPGVSFLREQGLRGIESGSAATGGLGGGDRLRELTRFSQGLATQDFGNQFNRLGALTGVGLTGAQALAGVGSTAAQGQAQAILTGARAESAGITGSKAAQNDTLARIGSALA